MKIAMLGTRGVPSTHGGVERHVEEVGARLVQRGHEVVVFCRSNYASAKPRTHRGMRLRWLPSLSSQALDASVHSLLSAIAALQHGYDIVHYHNAGPAAAALITTLSTARVVVTLHSLNSGHDKWGPAARALLARAEALSVRLPDRTIVVSRAWQQELLARYGRSTMLIGNGVNAPDVRAPGPVLDELGLAAHDYVLFVGRLCPEKGPDVLVEAYRRIPGDVPLVLVGGSPFGDRFEARLRQLAASDPRIIFAGFRFGAELAELYSNASLAVLPSRSEGQPLTLLEAATYQLPVVATAIPGIAEVVRATGATVELVPSDDPAAMADAVHAHLKATAPSMEREALAQRVLRMYSWDAVTGDLLGVYDDVMRRRWLVTRSC
jgi:glycosyltransferase involved in cell wall biosynthesis